ncbi:MAG: cyclic nucleotide-binding domain-containing protein [Acidimicrobiales bacterium]
MFHQGQPTDRFSMVYQGLCDVVSTSSTGKELIFTTLTAGDPIGEATILDGVPRTASIPGQIWATVLSIKRGAFLDLARANGDIALSLAPAVGPHAGNRLSARVNRVPSPTSTPRSWP